MNGSFTTKVLDALKSMQPVTVTLDLVDEDHLLEAAEVPERSNLSDSALQYPTPTIADELDRNELRKRFGVDPHTIPYGMQTGLTKYAPMPKRAGTTIANKPATPQYPPFPFSIATTYLPAPTIQYTDTAYLTWTTQSIENTVCLLL